MSSSWKVILLIVLVQIISFSIGAELEKSKAQEQTAEGHRDQGQSTANQQQDGQHGQSADTQNGNQQTQAAGNQQGGQVAASGNHSTGTKDKATLEGARDEFVGGVAAIGDSAHRAGQAVVNKAEAVRHNAQNAGHQIVESFSKSVQDSKDAIKNIGNTE